VVLKKVRQLFGKAQGAIDALNKVISESILGSSLIRLLNAQQHEYQKFLAANTEAKEHQPQHPPPVREPHSRHHFFDECRDTDDPDPRRALRHQWVDDSGRLHAVQQLSSPCLFSRSSSLDS
jgi:ABC-type multidrug transport system fused ATPase/permease subunit